jgi:hypothetical protein
MKDTWKTLKFIKNSINKHARKLNRVYRIA